MAKTELHCIQKLVQNHHGIQIDQISVVSLIVWHPIQIKVNYLRMDTLLNDMRKRREQEVACK